MTEAIEAYKASLEVRTRESAPVDWAAGQMNLGVAFHTLGAQTDDPVLFEKAAPPIARRWRSRRARGCRSNGQAP